MFLSVINLAKGERTRLFLLSLMTRKGRKMIKDLEPLLEQLCNEGNYDAESAIMQFGHGDCHDLTWALHEKYRAPIVAIVGKDSGLPVHSCVLIDESTTLDAYGINSLERTVERYSKLSMANLGETSVVKPVERDWILAFGGLLDESPDNILEEFQPIVTLLGVDLAMLFPDTRKTG